MISAKAPKKNINPEFGYIDFQFTASIKSKRFNCTLSESVF